MSTIKEGQYVIKSVEYKTQAMTNYPDGKVAGDRYVGGAAQIWNVKGNDQYGYTFENYAFHKFLDSLDNTVNATDKHTIWDIVGDDQKGYKIELRGVGTVAKLTGGLDFDPIVLANYLGQDDELWSFVPYPDL